MSYLKKLLAAVLILTMMAGLVVPGYAATSPGEVVEPVNPGFDKETKTETREQDGQMTITRFSSKHVTVIAIKQLAGYPSTKIARVVTAHDKDGKKAYVTKFGDGSKGVFASTKGRKMTKLAITSPSIIISKKAFSGSKISQVTITSKDISFSKGAFSGTKKKNPKIIISGAKRASRVSVQSGAFDGLSKKSKIVVDSKYMSKKEYKKLVSKLRKAGFTGTIERKTLN